MPVPTEDPQSGVSPLEITSDDPLYIALSDLFEKARREDTFIRERRIREWRKHEEYWQGVQYIFWDEFTGDWRLPPDELYEELPKVINIFKAHGESIIAALSTALPFVRWYPQDADSADDLSTAKAYSNASEHIQKDNDATLKFVQALYTLFNQDFVASYVYPETDAKYGSVETPVVETIPVEKTLSFCSDCGYPMDESGIGGNPPASPDQMQPGVQQMNSCPVCGSTAPPRQESFTADEPTITGYESEDKSKICIDIYGPLNVKIPYFCRKQAEMPYLILSKEDHIGNVRAEFPLIKDKITETVDYSDYDVRGRLLDGFYGESNITTTHRCWFRPSYYEMLENGDQEKIDALKSQFPDGCKATFVGTRDSYQLAEIEKANLDDYWDINFIGTSRYLHGQPLGAPLVPIQEIRNDVTDLTIKTVKHGIPETFADPEVLDFDEYDQHEAQPGIVYPAKPAPGKNISDSFYEVKTSTLSKEVQFLFQQNEMDGQFVVSDFPSVYGGPQEGGGTLGEYSMSRNSALQRLGLVWKALNTWWAKTMHLAVKLYVNHMKEDEKFVKKLGDSSFMNIWIRMAEITGEVGKVEAESSETLPISSAQKMDMILKLLQLGNEGIDEVMLDAQNSQFIAEALGFPAIKIPGQAQRTKQFQEIKVLLATEPIDLGNGEFLPSVDIEPELDDDDDHIDVLKGFLVENGTYLKVEVPAGYQNCMAHLRMHVEQKEMKELNAQMMEQPEDQETPVSETVEA